MKSSFITSAGAYLPGNAIGNDEMESVLGQVGSKPSRSRKRILNQNKIETRHYAIDESQTTTISNAGMAAKAIEAAMEKSDLELKAIELLTASTSCPDLPLPGFASMVHGCLDMPPCEIATTHGICASGMVGLRHASSLVQTGQVANAVCAASEFPSRLLKASRFQAQGFGDNRKLPFETEFLRWMLSDGAGAFVLQDRPGTTGLSLEIQWITATSYASQFDPCMFVGTKDEASADDVRGWLDYPDYATAATAGAINLRQNVGMLEDVVRLTVEGVFQLIEQGKLDPKSIDWYATHYSSDIFRVQALELLERGGLILPPDRVFSNLATKGNLGCASAYVMLEELLYSGKLEPGQNIFCIVPESGRFTFSYALLTVVEGESEKAQSKTVSMSAPDPVIAPEIKTSGAEIEESLVRQLTHVWNDFETGINQVPIIMKMNAGKLTLQDYRELLFNLRQQVIDGSRWISRAASNITRENFPIRSAFIGHSSDEHRDFEMLERNYVAVGGKLEDIQNGTKNIGSEALSEYILSRASREDPFDLIGAMFIIEGLGRRVARRWAIRIKEQLDLKDNQVSFLMYHSESDDIHFQRLDLAVQSGILDEKVVQSVIKTAKVVARLYLLQLEEIGNF